MMFCKGQSANAPAIIADRTLHVIDFKYGRGMLVEAENNPQRMLYALDMLSVFDDLYEKSKSGVVFEDLMPLILGCVYTSQVI